MTYEAASNIPSQRLAEFFPFDEGVLAAIDRAHAVNAGRTFAGLADYHGVAEGTEIVMPPDSDRPLELLTLKPRGDYDETHARVCHLAMANAIGRPVAMQMMHLFAADPTSPLIAVGNPSVFGKPCGRLGFGDAWKVGHGELAPTVDPLLRYLASVGITSADQIGYSYGAEKAAVAARRAAKFGIKVSRGVFMEAPSVVPGRPAWRLLLDFKSCGGKKHDEAIRRVGSDQLMEARIGADGRWALLKYSAGILGRVSNHAIGHALKDARFPGRLVGALEAQRDMEAACFSGDDSELAYDELMIDVVTQGRQGEHGGRAHFGRVANMAHGAGDDIDLHAALALQGLYNPWRLDEIPTYPFLRPDIK